MSSTILVISGNRNLKELKPPMVTKRKKHFWVAQLFKSFVHSSLCSAQGHWGFWSFAKHILYNYQGVSKFHFPMYLKEVEYRFNHRKENLLKLLMRLGHKKLSANVIKEAVMAAKSLSKISRYPDWKRRFLGEKRVGARNVMALRWVRDEVLQPKT